MIGLEIDAMQTVLVVDDDVKLLKMLQRTLAYEGLQVFTASNGEEALNQAADCNPDLLIVDWMMPKMDGLSLIQELRAEKNPAMILMLTARDAIENRVEGLQSGADDYLVKPFAPAELVARVHALLRRTDTKPAQEAMKFADVTLDPLTREVHVGERLLELTKTEFDLLEFFLRHPRQVLERAQILSSVWGYDFGGDDNVLEVYVGYLRKKMEAGGHARLIQTVRGIGYVMRAERVE
jgi:two-component system response regulator MprA